MTICILWIRVMSYKHGTYETLSLSKKFERGWIQLHLKGHSRYHSWESVMSNAYWAKTWWRPTGLTTAHQHFDAQHLISVFPSLTCLGHILHLSSLSIVPGLLSIKSRWQFPDSIFVAVGFYSILSGVDSHDEVQNRSDVLGGGLLRVVSVRLDPGLLHLAHGVLELLRGGQHRPHHRQLLLQPVDGLHLGHHRRLRLQVLPVHAGTIR